MECFEKWEEMAKEWEERVGKVEREGEKEEGEGEVKEEKYQLTKSIQILKSDYSRSLEDFFEKETKSTYSALTEVVDTLESTLRSHSNLVTKIDWTFRLKIATDLVKGVMYIHALRPPLVHRDLKVLLVLGVVWMWCGCGRVWSISLFITNHTLQPPQKKDSKYSCLYPF